MQVDCDRHALREKTARNFFRGVVGAAAIYLFFQYLTLNSIQICLCYSQKPTGTHTKGSGFRVHEIARWVLGPRSQIPDPGIPDSRNATHTYGTGNNFISDERKIFNAHPINLKNLLLVKRPFLFLYLSPPDCALSYVSSSIVCPHQFQISTNSVWWPLFSPHRE